MRPFALFLAVIFTLNNLVWAQSIHSVDLAREVELLVMAEKSPKEVLQNLTDEELIRVQRDLKVLIAGLQVDFSKAEAKDRDRLGYKIRKWGAISTGTLVLLTAAGTIARIYTYKGPSVDNDAVAVFILGTILTTGAIAVTAGGQVIVWLTPEEADKVQDKIDSLVKLSNAIDKKL